MYFYKFVRRQKNLKNSLHRKNTEGDRGQGAKGRGLEVSVLGGAGLRRRFPRRGGTRNRYENIIIVT